MVKSLAHELFSKYIRGQIKNKTKICIQLGIKRSNFYKMLKKWKNSKQNEDTFIHGNKGKIPSNKTSVEMENKILELIQSKKYAQIFSIAHFTEKIKKDENLEVKINVVKRILKENKISTRFTRKGTLKLWNKYKKIDKLETDKKAELEHLSNLILVKNNQHCSLPCPTVFGEIVEFDATMFTLPDGKIMWLHTAVDRATNKILSMKFDWQETLLTYLKVLDEVIRTYGCPAKIITDCRSCFKVLRNPKMDETKLTQFGYICEKIGTELYATSVSQRKARVERMNRTIKNRLPAEFSTLGIEEWTLEQANERAEWGKSYLNTTFNYDESGLESAFELFSEEEFGELKYLIGIRSSRKFGYGSVIQVNRKVYQAYDLKTKAFMNFRPYISSVLITLINGEKYIAVGATLYYAILVGDSVEKVKFPATPAQKRWLNGSDFIEYRAAHKVVSNELYEKEIKSREKYII